MVRSAKVSAASGVEMFSVRSTYKVDTSHLVISVSGASLGLRRLPWHV